MRETDRGKDTSSTVKVEQHPHGSLVVSAKFAPSKVTGVAIGLSGRRLVTFRRLMGMSITVPDAIAQFDPALAREIEQLQDEITADLARAGVTLDNIAL